MSYVHLKLIALRNGLLISRHLNQHLLEKKIHDIRKLTDQVPRNSYSRTIVFKIKWSLSLTDGERKGRGGSG